jgi:glycosyltransferase involved in cell wall biosynthesis
MIPVQARGPFLNLVPKGVNLIDLDSPRAILALPRLISYLRKANLDVLISAQTHVNAVAIVARWLSRVKMKLIITERNHMIRVVQHSRSIKERFRPLAVRLLYPYADQIIAVSHGVGESITAVNRLIFNKIHVIYNPFDIQDLQRQASLPADHPWLQQKNIPVIVAAGRLSKQKDVPTLLRAFVQLRSRMPARLIILGEGEERQALTLLIDQLGIAEYVSMPGFVDNPYAYMLRADLFVLSSAWEGFANVLVEALACGTRVVSTDCPGGPAEILEGGRFGRLVPVGDPSALASAIMQSMQAPFSAEILRARAKDFAFDQIIPQYLEALRS